MTWEEIRGLLTDAQLGPWEAEDNGDVVVASTRQVIADFVPRSGNRLLIAAAPELAALLVRAVEALAETVTAEPQTRLCYSKTCPGREFPCSVVDDARSLLRELGVEA